MMEKLDLDAVLKILRREISPDFFGTITLKVRDGRVVHLAIEKSFRIEDEQKSVEGQREYPEPHQ